jgi:hypothetical protein
VASCAREDFDLRLDGVEASSARNWPRGRDASAYCAACKNNSIEQLPHNVEKALRNVAKLPIKRSQRLGFSMESSPHNVKPCGHNEK